MSDPVPNVTPPPVEIDFDFSDWQVTNPTSPLPGDQLDAQLNTLASGHNALLAFIDPVLNDDGSLAPNTVGPDQLTDEAKSEVGREQAEAAAASAAQAGASATQAQGHAGAASASASQAQASASTAAGHASTASSASSAATASADAAALSAGAAASSEADAQISATEAGQASADAALSADAAAASADAAAQSATDFGADLTAHTLRADNPHGVTPGQVGNDVAQWNAALIHGRDISTEAPEPGDVLSWDGAASRWTPAAVSGGSGSVPPYILPGQVGHVLTVADPDPVWSPVPPDTVARNAAAVAQSTADSKVAKAGDTMSGALTLPGDPVEPLHAVTKQYMLDALSKGTLRGIVYLWGNETANPPTAGSLNVFTTSGQNREIRISKTDADGYDRGAGFLLAGDTLTLSTSATNFARYIVTALATEEALHWTIPCRRTDTQGAQTAPPTGTRVTLTGVLAGGSGALDQPTADARYVNLTGDTMSGALVVDASSADPALRVTQRGAGQALLVEDNTHPDGTPFVVLSDGRVVIGALTPPVGNDMLSVVSAGNNYLRVKSNYGGVVVDRNSDTVGNAFVAATNGVNRFVMGLTGAETGANVGGDLVFTMQNDAGTFLGTPLTIRRSTLQLNARNDATPTAPVYSFTGDGGMGMFRAGQAVLGFSTGAAQRLSISNTAITSTVPLSLPLGSAAAPALQFADGNSGLYSLGDDQINVATGGAIRLSVTTANLVVQSTTLQAPPGSAASPGIRFNNDLGTGLFRAGPNTMGFSTSSAQRLSISTTDITSTLPVTLPGPPTADLHAATKAYVDGKAGLDIPTADARYVQQDGDTMTGDLVIGTNMVLEGAAGGGVVLNTAGFDGTNYASAAVQHTNLGGVTPALLFLHITGQWYGMRFSLSNGGTYVEMQNSGVIVRSTDSYQVQWVAPSDIRIKTNIAPISTDALAALRALEVVSFDWNPPKPARKDAAPLAPTNGGARAGFVAQQVETILPEAVTRRPVEELDGGLASVDNGAMIPWLVRALQQQADQIDALTARIAAMEGTPA